MTQIAYISYTTDDPDEGEYRVLRGGGWINHARVCRSACRSRGVPSGRGVIIGFRFARVGQPRSDS